MRPAFAAAWGGIGRRTGPEPAGGDRSGHDEQGARKRWRNDRWLHRPSSIGSSIAPAASSTRPHSRPVPSPPAWPRCGCCKGQRAQCSARGFRPTSPISGQASRSRGANRLPLSAPFSRCFAARPPMPCATPRSSGNGAICACHPLSHRTAPGRTAPRHPQCRSERGTG